MATAETASTDTASTNNAPAAAPSESPARPFQFSLRQLFWLMGIVCVLGGAYSWLGIELFLGLACVCTLFCAAYFVTRRQMGGAIAVTMIVLPLIALVLPPLHLAPRAARRMSCQNNLHNLALALQNYHDVYGSFPPAYIADATGKPIHSWRVLILPFIEQKNLYDQYRFDEPWDGPNNSKLHNVELKILLCPSQPGNRPQLETSYVAVVGPRTVWPDDKTTRMSDIVDGTSNTLLIVEVHNSGIHWMEPRDLDYLQMAPGINPPKGTGISSPHPKIAQAAFVDGSVRALSDDTPPSTIRAIITRNGREKIPDDWGY